MTNTEGFPGRADDPTHVPAPRSPTPFRRSAESVPAIH